MPELDLLHEFAWHCESAGQGRPAGLEASWKQLLVLQLRRTVHCLGDALDILSRIVASLCIQHAPNTLVARSTAESHQDPV